MNQQHNPEVAESNEAQEPEVTETPMQDTEQTAQADAKEIIIEVANPSAEEMKDILGIIKADYDFEVDIKEVVFNFKKSKDKLTGVETIRKPVNLAIPYPSVDGIVSILQNTLNIDGEVREGANKGLELLQEAVANVINAQARELLYDDNSLSAATFPVDKLSWEHIANIPKVQRKGGGIPKEIWELFATDYVEIMPEITGKTIEAVNNMAKILMNKLSMVRTNNDVLNLVIEQLAVYADNSPNAEEYTDCISFLLAKAETFMNVTPEELLANL